MRCSRGAVGDVVAVAIDAALATERETHALLLSPRSGARASSQPANYYFGYTSV